MALSLRLTSGDTSVLTVSKNGHDAESILLNVGSETEIPTGYYFTIETLGTQSKVAFDKDNFKETIAPPDWRPLPRPSSLK